MKKSPAKVDPTEEVQLISWTDLRGYQLPWDTFSRLVSVDKVPQVLLLCGREGIGKRSFAAAMAAFFFCEHGKACGSCVSCRRVQLRTEPEIFWVDPESGPITVDDAEAIQEHLSYLSAPGFYGAEVQRARRIVMIVDADRFTDQAANRLLKILEEPPPNTHIFMTTSHEKRMLQTVLSRSVRWPIHPPRREEILPWLKDRLNCRGIQVNDDKIEETLRLSGLSPGVTLRILTESHAEDEERQSLMTLVVDGGMEQILERAEQWQKQWQYGANDLAERVEIILNQEYRQMFGLSRGSAVRSSNGTWNDPAVLRERRVLLREVKRIAGRHKVALNSQLAAESIGLVRSKSSFI